MKDRIQIPEKHQIRQITDMPTLVQLRDDLSSAATKIEVDLEYAPGDEEWEKRARNALFHHRWALDLVRGRIDELRRETALAERRVRDISRNDPLTNEVLEIVPNVLVEDFTTIEAVDEKIGWYSDRLVAVERDRADELGYAAQQRDEAFLAASLSAIRRINFQKSALLTQRGRILKAEKLAAQLELERVRERKFVEAARLLLPRETYLGLWRHVERETLAGEADPSEEGGP